MTDNERAAPPSNKGRGPRFEQLGRLLDSQNRSQDSDTQAAQRIAPRPLFAQLPEIEGGWRCLAADPAWRFASNSVAKPGRNAMRHYGCLSLDEIASLPLRGVVAKDALLWLWVPGPFLAVGAHVAVMRGWGFEPTAIGFTWVKLNRNAPELFIQRNDLFMGPGLTTRKNCEFVIIGKRGRPERLAMDVHEVVLAPIREHSRKPAEAYSRIERYCAGPRLELFARESRANWTSWGDEAAKFDQPKAAAIPSFVNPSGAGASLYRDAESAP